MSVSYPIQIDQGVNFSQTFNVEVLANPDLPYDCVSNPYVALDMTTYTAAFQVATYPGAIPVISLTTGSQLHLGVGTIVLTLLPGDTSGIAFSDYLWQGWYQLEIYQGSTVKRPVSGEFTITKEMI